LPAPSGETSIDTANGGDGSDASTGATASHAATHAASAAIVGRDLAAVGTILGVIAARAYALPGHASAAVTTAASALSARPRRTDIGA